MKIFICSILVILGLTHVSQGADQEKADSTKNQEWWNKTFVLSAFTSVQNQDDIEKVIAYFGEAGLNALECNTPLEYTAETLSSENTIRALRACQENNIKFFITNHNYMTGVSEPKTEELMALVNEYAKYPALGGYYVWDEPRNSKELDGISKSFRVFQSADPSRLPLVAFIPSYGPIKWPEKYPAFVREFVEKVDPPVLSFDYYAMSGKPGNYQVSQGLYQDLAMWSSLSLETGKPLWMYVTSCKWQSVPSLATLRIQVYTAIAYGAKGIQYFVAKSFTGRKPNFAGAPLNMDGTKSKFYETFKDFNMEIKAIAPTIMKLKLTELMHTEPLPPGSSPFVPHLGVKTAPDNLILSFHKATDGKNYLLLVSKNANTSRQIELTVAPETSLVLLPDMINQQREGDKIRFTIPAGGGMLFEIK